MNPETRRLRLIGCAIGIPVLMLQGAGLYLSTTEAANRLQAYVVPPATQCEVMRPGEVPVTTVEPIRGGWL